MDNKFYNCRIYYGILFLFFKSKAKEDVFYKIKVSKHIIETQNR